jgi:putative flippase GtrA
MKTSVQNAQGVTPASQTDRGDTDPSTRTVRETIRFGLVGLMNTAIDFVLFLLLTNLWHWNVLAAQTVSYLFGLINSYAWNRKVTFKSKERPASGEVVRFVGLNFISYLASLFILSFMRHFLVSNTVSKIIVTFATFAINFAGSKWWVFKQRSSPVRESL